MVCWRIYLNWKSRNPKWRIQDGGCLKIMTNAAERRIWTPWREKNTQLSEKKNCEVCVVLEEVPYYLRSQNHFSVRTFLYKYPEAYGWCLCGMWSTFWRECDSPRIAKRLPWTAVHAVHQQYWRKPVNSTNLDAVDISLDTSTGGSPSSSGLEKNKLRQKEPQRAPETEFQLIPETELLPW